MSDLKPTIRVSTRGRVYEWDAKTCREIAAWLRKVAHEIEYSSKEYSEDARWSYWHKPVSTKAPKTVKVDKPKTKRRTS
jgi:hypothetical protein